MILKSPFRKVRPKEMTSVFKFEKPGPLRHEVRLSLHTFEAELLFMGYPLKSRVGLLRFSALLYDIWEEAKKEYPYAEYYLWLIHEKIEFISRNLKAIAVRYEDLLFDHSSDNSFEMTHLASQKPVVRTLWFKTPYGYKAAGIIADFDRLLCLALTAYHVGIIPNKVYEALRDEWSAHITVLFQLPLEWQSLGVGRYDIANHAELSQKAVSLMGISIEDILDQTKRSPLTPSPKKSV